MDHVGETLLKRGLYRLGAASSGELASFSGIAEDAVDAYLTSRPDLVLPRQADTRWKLRTESRETLATEIKAGIEGDPERLSDALQPGFIDRVRRSLDVTDAIIDDLVSGAISEDRFLTARFGMMGKALRDMRSHGRDVTAEEGRLSSGEARYRAWLDGRGAAEGAAQNPGVSLSQSLPSSSTIPGDASGSTSSR